jgi:hypothetical protein
VLASVGVAGRAGRATVEVQLVFRFVSVEPLLVTEPRTQSSFVETVEAVNCGVP